MAYSIKSHIMAAYTASTGTVTPTWNSVTNAGNLGIVGISIRGNSTSAITEGSGSWSQAISRAHTTLAQYEIWYKPNIASSESNPVFTIGGTTLTGVSTILEIIGVNQKSPFEAAAAGALTAQAGITTGAGTTATKFDQEFAFFFGANEEGNTSGVTFTGFTWGLGGNGIAPVTIDTLNPAKNADGAITAWGQTGPTATQQGSLSLSSSTNNEVGALITCFQPPFRTNLNNYQFPKADDGMSVTEKIK